MLREIPEGSVEIQTGLWLHERNQTIGGNTYTFRDIYSAEGYCFWEVSQSENYDEEGNLKPPKDRIYAQYASLALCLNTVEKINAEFISVPVSDEYEIVSVGTPTETI